MNSDCTLERQVTQFRRFTRYYTKKIGVLRRFLLGSPFSVIEARVLWEVTNGDKVTATYLCNELQIDAGYLSRITQSLEKHGLIRREKAAHDGRHHHIFLTESGNEAFGRLNELSRAQATSILAQLTKGDRQRLVDAMETVEALMSKASIS